MGTKAKVFFQSKLPVNTRKAKSYESWALVTGASSGIGYAIAAELLREEYNLVIVSQNQERLSWATRNLKRLAKKDTIILGMAADLSLASAPLSIYRQLKNKGIFIHTLVNNAGIGLTGNFSEQEFKKEKKLMNLNIITLVELSHLFLKDMIERDRGRILNVASVAGFLAGPRMSVYYASKAFVLRFSEALHRECKGTGICVSALCPGPVDTPFFERSGANKRRFGRGLLARLLFRSPAFTARAACHGMRKKKAVIIPGIENRLFIFTLGFTPRSLVAKVANFLNTKTEK